MSEVIHFLNIFDLVRKLVYITKTRDMCQIEINKLVKARMLTLDQNIVITPTILGSLMAKYYIAFDTMKLFAQVTGNEIMQQIISLVSKCHEFSEMYLRVDDKKCLNLLNKNQSRQTIRFPLKGKIKTLDMKINCIIQAVLGCLEIAEHSILSESNKIMRNAERITKCLIEYLETREKCFLALLNTVILSKCFHAQLWEDSPYVSRQLTGIGHMLSHHLVNAGKTSFEKIRDSSPRELEMIMRKKPPFGDNVLVAVQHLPSYEICLDFVSAHSKIELKLTIILKNASDLETSKCTANANSMMCLLVGNNSNDVILYEKYTHSYMIENPEVVKYIDIEDEDTDYVTAHFISENWVGFDSLSTLKLKSDENTVNKLAETKRKKEKSRSVLQRFLDTNYKWKKGKSSKNKKESQIEKPLTTSQVIDSFTPAVVENTDIVERVQKPNSTLDQSQYQHAENSKDSRNCPNVAPPDTSSLKNYEIVTEEGDIVYCGENSDFNKDGLTSVNSQTTVILNQDEKNQSKPQENLTNPARVPSDTLQEENDTYQMQMLFQKSQLLQEQMKTVNKGQHEVNSPDTKNNPDVAPTDNSTFKHYETIKENDEIFYSDYNSDFNEDVLSPVNSQDTVILNQGEKSQSKPQHNFINLTSAPLDRSQEENIYRMQKHQLLQEPMKIANKSKWDEYLQKSDNFTQVNGVNFEGKSQYISEKINDDLMTEDSIFNTQVCSLLDNHVKSSAMFGTSQNNRSHKAEEYQTIQNEGSGKIDLQIFRKTQKNKLTHSSKEIRQPPESSKSPLKMYHITEVLHPSKKQRCGSNDQGSDEIMTNLEQYIQQNTQQSSREGNYYKKNVNQKSIKWRSPLVYSPPVKYSPKTPFRRCVQKSNSRDIENEVQNNRCNDTMETLSSSKSASCSETRYFKMPVNPSQHMAEEKLNSSKFGTQFPLSDSDCLDSIDSHASCRELFSSSVKKDDPAAALKELCSISFLDNCGLLQKSSPVIQNSQKHVTPKRELTAAYAADYYTNLLKDDGDSGFSSHLKNMSSPSDNNCQDATNSSVKKNSSEIQMNTQFIQSPQKNGHRDMNLGVFNDHNLKTNCFSNPCGNTALQSHFPAGSQMTTPAKTFSPRCLNRHSPKSYEHNPQSTFKSHLNATTFSMNSPRNMNKTYADSTFCNSNFPVSPVYRDHSHSNLSSNQILRSVENSTDIHNKSSRGQIIHKRCRNKNYGFARCENGSCNCGVTRYSKENIFFQQPPQYNPDIMYRNYETNMECEQRCQSNCSSKMNISRCDSYCLHNRLCNQYGEKLNENIISRPRVAHCADYRSHRPGSSISQHRFGGQCNMNNTIPIPEMSQKQHWNKSSGTLTNPMPQFNVSDDASWNSSDRSQRRFPKSDDDVDYRRLSPAVQSPSQNNRNIEKPYLDHTSRSPASRNNLFMNPLNVQPSQSYIMKSSGRNHVHYRPEVYGNEPLFPSDCDSCYNRTLFENSSMQFCPLSDRGFPEYGVHTPNINDDQMLERYYSHYIGDKQYVMNKFFDSLREENPEGVYQTGTLPNPSQAKPLYFS